MKRSSEANNVFVLTKTIEYIGPAIDKDGDDFHVIKVYCNETTAIDEWRRLVTKSTNKLLQRDVFFSCVHLHEYMERDAKDILQRALKHNLPREKLTDAMYAICHLNMNLEIIAGNTYYNIISVPIE